MKSTPLLIYREILPDLPLFLRRHTWPRPQPGFRFRAMLSMAYVCSKTSPVSPRSMERNIAGRLSGGVNSSVMEAFSLRSDA